MNCGFGKIPDQYKHVDKISVTKAMRLLRCPAKFKYEIDNPIEQTRAMKQGSMTDLFILSPNEFFKTYEVLDKSKYLDTADDYKARLTALNLSATGTKEVLKQRIIGANAAFRMEFLDEYMKEVKKEFISQDQLNELIQIKAALYNDASLINHFGNVEDGMNQVLGWKYLEEYDTMLTFKLDRLYNGNVIDIKKTPSCEYYKFQRKVQEENLFIQAAAYMYCMKDLAEVREFYFYAYEHEAPYIWQSFRMPIQFLDEGLAELFRAIRLFKECKQNNYWPSYEKGPLDIHPSTWFIDTLEKKRENELED